MAPLVNVIHIQSSEIHYRNRKREVKKKKKTQLGTRIADVSCLQKQIKTAGPLQQDVIRSITVLSFNNKKTMHTYTQFQHNLIGVKKEKKMQAR